MRDAGSFDDEYDVVVLGAGAAGMTAAFVAANEGLRVLLVEQAAHVGGSTSWAAGTAWIPGNFTMDEAAARLDVDEARRYLNHLVGDQSDAALRDVFLEQGPAMLRYLLQHSTVRLKACPKHMDYYPDIPGARPGGRPVEAMVFNGRDLGRHFNAVKPPPPEFTLFGGMMVSKADIDAILNCRWQFGNLKHVVSLVSRYAVDRILGFSRGTRLTMGNALAARLLQSVLDVGVSVSLRCETTKITNDADSCHTLTLTTAKAPRTVKSTKAVIFAGGGFSAKHSWREQYMPSPVPDSTAASTSNDASTLELALGLGARLESPREQNAWWFPTSKVPRRDGSVGIFPHIVMDRAKPGVIAVDRRGQRFVNEGVNYHEFSLAQYRFDAVPCWLVCDNTFIRRYGLGAVRPGGRSLERWVRCGYIKRAMTLNALANLVGIDAKGLEDSAEQMAQFAATGKDGDFAKGSDSLSRQNGDSKHTPNPCLGAITNAPFFAVEVSPADLGTSLGLKTNQHAQLVDGDGQPLPGLYAAGNDMNSIMGGQYPAPGVSIGPAMTFGYLAALHAAGDS